MRISPIVLTNISFKQPSFCAIPEKPDWSAKHISNLSKIQKYPVKVVFSDIDGTAVYNDEPTDENKRAIARLKEMGIPLVFVTGRNLVSAQPALDAFGVKPDYLITEQGAVIFKDGKEFSKKTLDLEDAKEIIRFADEYKKKDPSTQLLLTFDNQAYIQGKQVVGGEGHLASSTKVVGSFDGLLAKGLPTKAVFVKAGAKCNEDLQDLRGFLGERLGSRYLNIFNSGKCYEVISGAASKAIAVQEVARDMGIELKNATALGDAENDLPMIKLMNEADGLSIAMGNAVPELKDHASVITDSAQESGFARAIGAISFGSRSLINYPFRPNPTAVHSLSSFPLYAPRNLRA